MKTFRVGVNYWPRRSAMYMWKRFDIAEIRDDLAYIAARGLDFVRFFLLWEDFQPEPERLDQSMRQQLVAFVDAAGAAGLSCMPTLFTGHMSGVNWLPEWTLDRAFPARRFRTFNSYGERPYGIRDFYRGELLDAQVRFAEAAGSWLREHPAVLAWDLGNEFSNVRAPSSPADAAEWSARLTAVLTERSGISVTAGLHGEDLTEDRGIRLSSIAAAWPFATMHGYAAYSRFARSPGDDCVAPFLYEVSRSFARRDVLFSELGTPLSGTAGAMPGLSEDGAAAYCAAVVDRLWRAGALGAAWWCFADYARELAARPPFDRAPHELSFGMVRADGSEKPVAHVLSRIANERRPVHTGHPFLALDENSYYAGLPQTLDQAYEAYLTRSGAR